MTKNKQVGIWMDHASANILEISGNYIITQKVKLANGLIRDKNIYNKDEAHQQNKEQKLQLDFYKILSEKIKEFDSVLLFGPTNAKTELQNILEKDKQFDEIKIYVKDADKMTKKQRKAFVSEYFSAKGK